MREGEACTVSSDVKSSDTGDTATQGGEINPCREDLSRSTTLVGRCTTIDQILFSQLCLVVLCTWQEGLVHEAADLGDGVLGLGQQQQVLATHDHPVADPDGVAVRDAAVRLVQRLAHACAIHSQWTRGSESPFYTQAIRKPEWGWIGLTPPVVDESPAVHHHLELAVTQAAHALHTKSNKNDAPQHSCTLDP